jgi:hypothetical protein
LKWLEAKILVFPHEKNWLKSYLAERGAVAAIDMIKKAFPDNVSEIVKDIEEKGTDEALKLWTEYSKRNEEKIRMKCYLIPSLSINSSKSNKDQITLKDELEYIESNCSSIGYPPTSEKDMALYHSPNLEVADGKSLLSITLQRPSIEGLIIEDSDANKGRIDQIQMNVELGEWSYLVIQTIGVNAGKWLVSPKDFNFSTFTCTKPFCQCEKLLPR